MSFELARQVADAVLFEGYVLYPYRASAQKNQVRWQFGVVAPRGWAEAAGEPWAQQTECLVEALAGDAALHVKLRCLQLQSRTVEAATAAGGFAPVASLEAGGAVLVPWDEGVEREVDLVAFPGRLRGEQALDFELPGGEEVEPLPGGAGRLRRRRWPVGGRLRLAAEPVDGPYGLVRLRLRAENRTAEPAAGAPREAALRRSLVGAHTLLAVTGGRFVSLLDPPEWARAAADACENLHTWPVLVGADDRRDVLLSSPIILYDYPAVAPESPGDLFDATEIDEILTLRTLTLTEQEKREARGTDPRAAALVDRVDAMPPEVLARLHGALRSLRPTPPAAPSTGAPPWGSPDPSRPTGAPPWGSPDPSGAAAAELPWWDPAADASVSPETDSVRVGPVAVARGSRVRLQPGRRRADAQDMFLAGRLATVEAVLHDLDDAPYLAVTLDDDEAAELHRWHGRFLYFGPDEVEPLPADGGRDR